jgi:hypothetical protein
MAVLVPSAAWSSAGCNGDPSISHMQGDKVKKGQTVGYVEQLGTFVAVEVRFCSIPNQHTAARHGVISCHASG